MSEWSKLYQTSLFLGRFLGCHQRPDRSFFIRGKQFPVCARCTGLFVGECVGFVCYRLIKPPIAVLLVFCGLMFLDWLVQYLRIRESTNTRRFITGLLCGYAYLTLVLQCLIALKSLITSTIL